MKFLTGLFDKLAGASGLSWLTMLPWILLAWGGSVAGAGAWGWHQGGVRVEAKYKAAQAAADGVAAQALLEMTQHVADTSLQILRASKDYIYEINLSTMKRQQIVAKVTADARADTKLAACTIPAATYELRREQVAQSAAIAAGNHPM